MHNTLEPEVASLNLLVVWRTGTLCGLVRSGKYADGILFVLRISAGQNISSLH